MLRKIVCVAVVLTVGIGVAVAEEMGGVITKVDGSKITFRKGKKELGEEMVLTVADKVKVVNAKINFKEKKIEVGDELENGLKNDRFAKIGKGGVRVQIVTNDDNKVTEIRVFPPFKKKKKSDN
ncbi:MAG TPA: hypothetical protein VKE98_08315 [Gemmataceae bacterium]|nr:hypothetical protein [Gemmataceae bacterium]